MTSDEREEAVLRGRAAARAGRSLSSNPYDPDTQADLWNVWRFAYADASESDSD